MLFSFLCRISSADYSFPFWLCGCVSCMMILSATALKQNFHSHFHQISANVSHIGVNHISFLENSSHRHSSILYYIRRNNRIIALMTRTNAGNDWYTYRWGISNVFSKMKKKVKRFKIVSFTLPTRECVTYVIFFSDLSSRIEK